MKNNHNTSYHNTITSTFVIMVMTLLAGRDGDIIDHFSMSIENIDQCHPCREFAKKRWSENREFGARATFRDTVNTLFILILIIIHDDNGER